MKTKTKKTIIIISAISLIGAGAYYIYDNWEKVKNFLQIDTVTDSTPKETWKKVDQNDPDANFSGIDGNTYYIPPPDDKNHDSDSSDDKNHDSDSSDDKNHDSDSSSNKKNDPTPKNSATNPQPKKDNTVTITPSNQSYQETDAWDPNANFSGIDGKTYVVSPPKTSSSSNYTPLPSNTKKETPSYANGGLKLWQGLTAIGKAMLGL